MAQLLSLRRYSSRATAKNRDYSGVTTNCFLVADHCSQFPWSHPPEFGRPVCLGFRASGVLEYLWSKSVVKGPTKWLWGGKYIFSSKSSLFAFLARRMVFKSAHPDIDFPSDLTVWEWLFESKYSPIRQHPANRLAGYTNAITKERVDWAQVKEHATYVSTALVRTYGMRDGQTVLLFSQNTIWYPVAQLATIRAAYNVEEMSFALKTAKAKFLFTVPNSLDVAIAAAENVGIAQAHIFLLKAGFATTEG